MLLRIWLRYHCCRGAGWAYRLIVVCWLWVVSYVGIRRVMYHAIGDTLLTRDDEHPHRHQSRWRRCLHTNFVIVPHFPGNNIIGE
jgi:hypothetical protein